jgi:hypothetical protein
MLNSVLIFLIMQYTIKTVTWRLNSSYSWPHRFGCLYTRTALWHPLDRTPRLPYSRSKTRWRKEKQSLPFPSLNRQSSPQLTHYKELPNYDAANMAVKAGKSGPVQRVLQNYAASCNEHSAPHVQNINGICSDAQNAPVRTQHPSKQPKIHHLAYN